MQNNEIQTKEAVNEEQATTENRLVKIGSNVVNIDKYKTTVATKSNMIANLEVPYDDLNVLLEDTEELKLVNDFFKDISCKDKGIETLIYETIGSSLFKTAILNKAIIYWGCGRNGKSKIFRILEAIAPNQCSHEHLEQLSGNKTGGKSTIRKLFNCTVNIAEDQIQPKYINTSYITRLISGEPISLEEKRGKNLPLKPFVNYATLLFSTNEVIKFKQEVGISLTDRFVVVPFRATFTDENGNRKIDIGQKLCQPLPLQIIATRAILEFFKVLHNGKFTIPDNVKRETERYFMQENHTLEFCNLFKIKTFISKTEYYKRYQNWCYDNFYEPLNNAQFGKQVLTLGYRSERFSFDSKRIWCYVNSALENDRCSGIYQDFKRKQGTLDFETYLCKQFDDEENVDDTQKLDNAQTTQEKQKLDDEQTIGNEQHTQEAQNTENEETASNNT